MRKAYFYLIMTALFMVPFWSFGQNMVLNSGFESWDDPNTPTDWVLAQNISQESSTIHDGTYSAGHTSDGAKKLKQVVPGVVPGQDYTFSFWYYDNTNAAKIKLASAWANSSGQTVAGNEAELSPSSFNPDDDQWHQYSVVVTAPAEAAKLRILVKVLDQGTNSGGTVYYDDFYFGDVVSKPEPTNYPTNLAATTEVLDIRYTWEPSVGEQLPDGYLITGAKDNFTAPVPVDGTPVEDDLDWSDGLFAVNIDGDVSNYSFVDLEGKTGYTITIYPYTNSGAYIDYKTDGTAPPANATTVDADMISFEGFESGTSGSWMAYNVSGDQEWIFPEFGGKYTAKMYGAHAGVNYANEDWLISSSLDLTSKEDVYFSFTNVKNLDGDPLMLFASTDYDGSGNPNDFTWDDITDQATWSSGDYEYAFTEGVDLGDYEGGSVYLAFKYTSTDAAAAVYKLDNMQVYILKTVGVNENSTASFSVYPNPAQDYITFNSDHNGSIAIIDASGRVVKNAAFGAGTTTLSVSGLNNGVYIVKSTMDDGSVSISKLVVE